MAAALAVVDDVGVGALTIRAVAARAGVPAMSLYSHFATKEDLLDLMFEEVQRRLFMDNSSMTWQAECAALCHQIRRTLLQHPRWAALLSRPVSAQQLPLRERMLSLMTSDGMTPAAAFRSFYNLGLVAIGLTLSELTLKDAQGRSSVEQRFELLKQGMADDALAELEPSTRHAISQGGVVKLEENFSAAVTTFIKGLEAERGAS